LFQSSDEDDLKAQLPYALIATGAAVRRDLEEILI